MSVLPLQSRCKKPIAARCLAVTLMLGLASRAQAETNAPSLDRTAVARLAAARGPAATVSALRVAEARAGTIGAGTFAPQNPELSAFMGPRFLSSTTGVDYFLGLAWPFDVSGAPSKRADAAADRVRAAESDAAAVRQSLIADALEQWVSARSDEARVDLETARLAVDRTVLRAAEVRKAAGTVGDGDVALARVLVAQARARLTTAEHRREGDLARLRARVGLAPATPVDVTGSLVPTEPRPLTVLVARLRSQPGVVRSLDVMRAAESEARLQNRVGYPIPRVTASTGRDPDGYVHVGLDVPIPVYQRNQTNAAVADARAKTAEAEHGSALLLGDAELRAAYAAYEGARDAFRTLDEVAPSVDDAEHLAIRSYELGQSSLSDLATARREAAAARVDRLEAEITLARARIALDALTGEGP